MEAGSGPPANGARALLLRGSLGLGGACLLLAMAVDFTGVVTRHLGIQVLGLIEITQMCIVGVVSSALVVATVTGAHAAVHLLTTRLGPRWKGVLTRFGDGLSGITLLLLAAGSVWILAELAAKGEQSDLLHIPFAPARALWTLVLVLAALLEGAAMLVRSDAAASVSGTSVYEP